MRLIAFNVMLQLAAGLFLARLVVREDGDAGAAPSWSACALGLLLATALNPGFVPRYHLTGYGEPGVTVTLAFAAWFAVRAIERIEAPTILLLAFTLAALVNIKQDSIALVGAVLATAAALALFGARPMRALAALALAALPAAVLYLAWRWYVLTHMPQGEIAFLPAAQWQPARSGWCCSTCCGSWRGRAFSMPCCWRRSRRRCGAAGAIRRGGWASCWRDASCSTARRWCWPMSRLFPGTMGSDAHSYFRYSTHLSLLLMVVVLLLLRESLAPAAWVRFAPALPIVIMLGMPVAFLPRLRFDLEPPALRVWLLAQNAARFLPQHGRVALVLPGDNGSVAAMLETVLRTAPPRRPELDLEAVSGETPDLLDRLAAEGYRFAIVSCVPSGSPTAPQGGAAILDHGDADWHEMEAFRYPAPPPGRWSHVLSYAPLCLR